MQLVVERSYIDEPLTFDVGLIQLSFHCVHPIHANVFSIQMLQHFSLIAPRVCTSVLFKSAIRHIFALDTHTSHTLNLYRYALVLLFFIFLYISLVPFYFCSFFLSFSIVIFACAFSIIQSVYVLKLTFLYFYFISFRLHGMFYSCFW